MLKERIQEVFDFTKSESPYKKANKGWINQDIFLDLSPSSGTLKQKKELAKVTFLWSPINRLLSNIFLIIIVGSLLVFTSVYFTKSRFHSNLFNNSAIIDIAKSDGIKAPNTSGIKDIDATNPTTLKNLDTKDLDETTKTNSLNDDLMKADPKIINQKTDKEESLIKEIQSNKDIQILQNKKQKSNFI